MDEGLELAGIVTKTVTVSAPPILRFSRAYDLRALSALPVTVTMRTLPGFLAAQRPATVETMTATTKSTRMRCAPTTSTMTATASVTLT